LKFIITIFQDEDGMFVAECPAIPGCISQGQTRKEAEQNIRNAIIECIQTREEKGMPLNLFEIHNIEINDYEFDIVVEMEE
jgi:predicted RNase H-like HicB family nuclease